MRAWIWSSCARWMGRPSEARCVLFICQRCECEQVNRPDRVWTEGHTTYGTCRCLLCDIRLHLRMVGRDWEPFTDKPCVIWQIDGPEIQDDLGEGGASD